MAELPESFLNSMKTLLGQEYTDYLACFSKERLYGIRVNTNKISVEHFQKICPFPIRQVPWIENGFFYDGKINPAKHPYYAAGLYYIQEPSAMTPAEFLPVEEGDCVCDLCAAPGGKATELGARLHGTGFLLANDISNSRAMGLLKNLELFGLHNICVSSERPQKLLSSYGAFFDKILVDAPCSGEGMFRRDRELIKSYREHGPSYYSEIQKQLVLTAADMLKPGGYMVYSTCTFSEKEDEEVISFLLRERPAFSVCDLHDFGRYYDGFAEGKAELANCVRIFPHRMEGEGHFIALLHKAARDENGQRREDFVKQQKPCRNASLLAFLSMINAEFKEGQITEKKGEVYFLSDQIFAPKEIRFLRTGLHLGTIKKDRFEPSQALAMALGPGDFAETLPLSTEDDRVIRYLKGETIDISDQSVKKGWCLVTVDGFPLGFGKGNGTILKNKYRTGWRWM